MNVAVFGLVCGAFVVLTGLSIANDVELVVDDGLNEIISENEFVLVLFQKEPCIDEDCKATLRETALVANSSYIPGLKVVRLVNSVLHTKYSLGTKSRLIFYRKALPILLDSGEIRMDDVVVWLEQNKDPNTRYLDTQNFEHLTQAASGATTGDWFVLFHKDSCSHLLPLWESVGSHLRHKINIAVVDTTASPELKARFRITKCPAIIYFRLGRMYKYELSNQDLKTLIKFADGLYVNAPSSKVPSEPTPFDVLTDEVVAWLKARNFHELLNWTSGAVAASLVLVLAVGCFCLRRTARTAVDRHSKSE